MILRRTTIFKTTWWLLENLINSLTAQFFTKMVLPRRLYTILCVFRVSHYTNPKNGPLLSVKYGICNYSKRFSYNGYLDYILIQSSLQHRLTYQNYFIWSYLTCSPQQGHKQQIYGVKKAYLQHIASSLSQFQVVFVKVSKVLVGMEVTTELTQSHKA